MHATLTLASISKTLLLKGSSDFPGKIVGDFRCSVGGIEFLGLRVSEGHASRRDIGVVRVLWIECGLDQWDLDSLFSHGREVTLTFRREADEFEFLVQRVTPSVEALVNLSSFPKWVRGRARIDDSHDALIDVFEPESNRPSVYLRGNSALLKRIAKQVQVHGSHEITVEFSREEHL